MTSQPQIEITFWGHACIGVHVDHAPLLLIDPFDPKGLGGITGPSPIPNAYPYVIATHIHSDHAAFHTQPQAKVLHAATQETPLSLPTQGLEIHARRVAHDEFGGRLRGGTTLILDIRIAGRRLVHCGDVGERLHGPTLSWLQEPRPDVLVVPAGGYFTIGADGAATLASEVQPRHVLFCHTRDDGLPLPQMEGRAVIQRRTAAWQQTEATSLTLTPTPPTSSAEAEVQVVWLTRPDGLPFTPSNQHG